MHAFYDFIMLFLSFCWIIKIKYVNINNQFNFFYCNLTVDNKIFWVRTGWGIFIFCVTYRRAWSFPRNFLTSLIAGLVFSKYTDLICIFNQCSNRVHFQPACRSRPAFRSTCHAILSRGTSSPRSGLSDEIRYSQFRPTIAEIEKQRGFILFFLTVNRSVVSPQPPHASCSAIVQPFLLNSISFVSFHVFCYARSTCVRNKMVVKLIRNGRTICEKSTHCK